MEQGFCLFVELFPSTGVLWVIGVRLHISILNYIEVGYDAISLVKITQYRLTDIQLKRLRPWIHGLFTSCR